MSESEIYRKRVQSGERPSQDIMTPFEDIDPQKYNEAFDGLQEENRLLKSGNKQIYDDACITIKENVDLKERLKNCLNHDSLLATRSELNTKDTQIAELQEANKEYLLTISALNDLGVRQLIKITELQNSRKELKAELISIAAWVVSEMQGDEYTEASQTRFYNNVFNRLKALSANNNKELDDELF